MGAVRAVLGISDVRRFELGWGCSVVGELAGTIALAVYAYDHGGPALVAVYGIARTLPGAVMAPLVMSLSDRMRRELLLRLATRYPGTAVRCSGGRCGSRCTGSRSHCPSRGELNAREHVSSAADRHLAVAGSLTS